MNDNNSFLGYINGLLSSLLLGAFIWGVLKLLVLAYLAFAAIFWEALCWSLKEIGILLLRTYNRTRRLVS
jgi:hypothetical protein